jgi:rhamnosyltransferase subunit B
VRILMMAVGSLGDNLPLMAMGKQLQGRGHEVRLYGNDYFRARAEALGLHFIATSPASEYQAFLDAPAAIDPKQAMRVVAAGVMGKVAAAHALMRADVIAGQTIALGSTFAFAPPLLAETDGVPVGVLHLAPAVLRSVWSAPRFSPLGHLAHLPRWIKRLLWRTMDRKFMDPLYTAPFNRIRAGLSLPPVERMFHQWLHQADAALCLAPAWFSPRQPDWPAHVALTGFPLEAPGNAALPADVAAFLTQGNAPVVITAGTANAVSHAFFRVAIAACMLAGRRALVVTADARQLPPSLPEGIMHAAYVPFDALLPRAAALIHHGGIGTVGQALRAGIPQLIQPMAFDQFDNASRVVQLGAGSELPARQFKEARVVAALQELLDSPAIAAHCKRHAAALAGADGVTRACDLVLEQLVPNHRQARASAA